jgi:hypothetical protein
MRKRNQHAVPPTVSSTYASTPAERKTLGKLIGQLEQTAPHAAAKIEADQSCVRCTWDHPDPAIAALLWASALGTTDSKFAGTVFQQLVHISRTGGNLTADELNGTLSLVRGLAPADPTEALLAAQMVAVHKATMQAAARLLDANTPAAQDSASTMLNKLARTFAMQIEALKRYRLKGEQTIKVQHVTVNDGGQAIVGDVQHTTGALLNNERQSHEQLSAPDALGAALLGPIQTNGQGMPSPRCEGTTGLPVPRRARRSAKRDRQRSLPSRPLHQ